MTNPDEFQQANMRVDQRIHKLMNGAKEALGLTAIGEAYSLAASEFLANHPDIAEQVQAGLRAESEVVTGALEKLSEIRSAQN